MTRDVSEEPSEWALNVAYEVENAFGCVSNMPDFNAAALVIETALAAKLAEREAEAQHRAQIELWFFRDIDDEARRKLIALCLGSNVAEEAKFHEWQRKCLRRILARATKDNT